MTETSATSSASSSIIQALGAGSGIDMAGLASQLATAQFEVRAQRLAEKGETLEQQISAASSIKNSLSLLASALGERVRTGDLSPKPGVANPAVATASSPLGSTGQGSYSLEVLQLASAQTLSAPAVADATAAVGTGTLTFRFGATGSGSFTEGTAEAVTVDIAEGATLNDVAKAINAKSMGVTAYVAQTSSGAQLVMKGSEGEQSGFIVEGAGDAGVAALGWNPAAGGDPARLLSTAGDAAFRLDGLDMTSASNDTGAIAPGLQLSLTGTNAGVPTKISFADPSPNISSAMQDLVGALNEIAGDLNTVADPLGGELGRDPGARALRRALSQLGSEVIMPNAAEGAPRTLSDLGLAIERDGTFRLDTERLQATLERDPAGAAAMFTSGLYGVYSTIDGLARDAASSSNPGSLAGSIARYQGMSEQVTEDTAELAEKQEALRASLTTRFAAAESRITASQSTLSFLQSQIEAWNSQRD